LKRLVITEKTGFTSLLPFKIYDAKTGFLFYADFFVKQIAKGKRLNFNLPKGVYFYEGFITKLPKPVETRVIDLPEPERNIPYREYKILFAPNPNKCTIFYKKGEIIFDTMFKNVPLYMRFGVYFHEMGHLLYSTESKADLFAAKMMLDLGFNPSQVGYTNLEMLSERQKERKKEIIDKLTR